MGRMYDISGVSSIFDMAKFLFRKLFVNFSFLEKEFV